VILALDTSSALTSVAVIDDDGAVVAEHAHEDARRHAEVIGPILGAVIASIDRRQVTTIACGVGPGPYTGLRVGIASAIAIGVAWDVPVVGLCSLDALAAEALAASRVPRESGRSARSTPLDAAAVEVASDARRSEMYWAQYSADGTRIEGPRVRPAADVSDSAVRGMPSAVWVARRVQQLLGRGMQVASVEVPLDAHGDDTGATADALAGAGLLLPRPLYLRRPDAMVPGGVSA